MVLAGINKKRLSHYGGKVHCFMAEEKIAKLAKEKQATRASVSMEEASRIEKPLIFAIGNAPTALIRLYEMIRSGEYKPAFIIGVPVGFVNVVAAKELILKTEIPHIINQGRKGGSNVAAAICNAIIQINHKSFHIIPLSYKKIDSSYKDESIRGTTFFSTIQVA